MEEMVVSETKTMLERVEWPPVICDGRELSRTQFDDCPGCGKVLQVEMIDLTHDDPMFCVLCRPCQWAAHGETVEQAIENWNRRHILSSDVESLRTQLESARERLAGLERMVGEATEIHNDAIDGTGWIIRKGQLGGYIASNAVTGDGSYMWIKKLFDSALAAYNALQEGKADAK